MTIEKIALVGLPGSGKSTVGAELARRLGRTLVDTDAEVEASAGEPVPSLILSRGEESFRAAELAALQVTLGRPGPAVIACGGGLLTREPARRLFLERTCAVWLDAPDETLLSRLGAAAGRPLLREDPPARLAALRAERRHLYAQAHLRVSTEGRTASEVAAELEAALGGGVRIPVAGRPYHVSVAPGAASQIALHLPADATRVVVVADDAVGPLTRRLVSSIRGSGVAVRSLSVRGGEGVKTWAAAGRLLDRLAGAGLGRGDCLVAAGGGTVGDLCGFAAAAYLRGIAWVNVPTTLLAMVDSAVGGKTGVNLRQGKNLAGAFWQPRAVICDTEILAGLPDRAFRAAFSEIVKYSMIGDRVSPSWLDDHLDALLARDRDALAAAVRDCCAAKGEVVAADEREGDLRAILNYGHTVGHALEAATGYGDRLWHGEAVAVGMRAAGRLSTAALGCPVEDIEWQDGTLARCGLGSAPPVDVGAVVSRLGSDKKAVAGRVRWVLLEGRGRPRPGQQLPGDLVRDTLRAVLPT